jgi:hypothetical protein
MGRDLDKIPLNDVKRAMRFTEDDLMFAQQIPMLFTREEI